MESTLRIKHVQINLACTSAKQLSVAEHTLKQLLDRDIVPRLGNFLSGLPDNASPLHIPQLVLPLGEFSLADFSRVFLRAFETAWVQHFDALALDSRSDLQEQSDRQGSALEVLPEPEAFVRYFKSMLESGLREQPFSPDLLVNIHQQTEYWKKQFFQIIGNPVTRSQMIRGLDDDALLIIFTVLTGGGHAELGQRYPEVFNSNNATEKKHAKTVHHTAIRLSHWEKMLDSLSLTDLARDDSKHSQNIEHTVENSVALFIPTHYLQQWQNWRERLKQLTHLLPLIYQDKAGLPLRRKEFLTQWKGLEKRVHFSHQVPSELPEETPRSLGSKVDVEPFRQALRELHRSVVQCIRGCLQRNQSHVDDLLCSFQEPVKDLTKNQRDGIQANLVMPESMQSFQHELRRMETVLARLADGFEFGLHHNTNLAAQCQHSASADGELAERQQLVLSLNSLTRLCQPHQAQSQSGKNGTETRSPIINNTNTLTSNIESKTEQKKKKKKKKTKISKKTVLADASGLSQQRLISPHSNLPSSDKQAPLITPRKAPIKASTNISNAGLVIIAPFIHRLFSNLQWTHEQGFVSTALQQRGALLLEYLASGETDFTDCDLRLNHVLCGLNEKTPPWPRSLHLTEFELTRCNQLLNAIITYWKNPLVTDQKNLRGLYLQRSGELDHCLLQPQAEPQDALLSQLSWGVEHIKLPWMPDLLAINWRQ